ncbi:hypothetical protein FA10DRAFT_81806 [Acaromyces ingoldii]|uniref:Uncharacterized protein n=1 Tax=Acaromyces ingoldii TaxID=215250 RepID=A0A316YTR4_9BASI|nr:hypothetical protein FA10DRAFT_81806 [Acaromyces ingoldii]PWN92048.1 hypothetical protein FA10DRAFT_81806 [Acaromyces ingoldii]
MKPSRGKQTASSVASGVHAKETRARAHSLTRKRKYYKILFPTTGLGGSLLVLDSRYSKAGSTSPFPLSMMMIFYFLPLLFLYSSPRLSDA